MNSNITVIRDALCQLKKKYPNYFQQNNNNINNNNKEQENLNIISNNNAFNTFNRCSKSKNDISIIKSGLIQDQLFKQDQEIFAMMKNDHDQDVEGFSYQQINQDPIKEKYLKEMRKNIPKYFYLKHGHTRRKHFQNCGKQYFNKLGYQLQRNQNQKGELNDSYQDVENKIVPKLYRQRTPYKLRKDSKILVNNQKLLKQQKQQKQQKQKKQQKLHKLQSQQKKQNVKDQKSSQFSAQLKVLKQDKLCYSTPVKEDRPSNSNQQNLFQINNKNPQQSLDQEELIEVVSLAKPKKRVKFEEVQYVKDFNKFKTPKKVSHSCQKHFALRHGQICSIGSKGVQVQGQGQGQVEGQNQQLQQQVNNHQIHGQKKILQFK